MKLISIILAATASITLAATFAEIPKAAVISARDDCKTCDDFYHKCRGSFWCWLNPTGCAISCRTDACRKFEECHNKCGYAC